MTVQTAPDPALGILIQDIGRLMRREFNRRVHDLGLTQTQWRALAQLSRNEGIKQAALADLLEVQPITLARLIDRMEAAGWVERQPHPQDRRAVRLFLTEKAGPVLNELWTRADRLQREAMGGLPAEEQARLFDMLSQVKQNLAGETDFGGDEAETTVTAAAPEGSTANE